MTPENGLPGNAQPENLQPDHMPPENSPSGDSPTGPSQPELMPPAIPTPEAGGLKPDRRLWGAWPTVGLGLVVFIVNQIAQAVIAIIFAVILIIERQNTGTAFDPFQFADQLTTNGLMLSIALIVSAAAGIGLIILFIKIRKGISILEYLALHRVNPKTVLTMLAIVIVILGLSFGVDQVVKTPPETDIIANAYKNTGWPVLFWLAVVVFAPAFEESLFRGFLFAGLKQSAIGPVGTIILTALVFAALHALQYGVSIALAMILVLGIVLGMVRYRTGSLWSSIALHSFWNLLQMVILTIQ